MPQHKEVSKWGILIIMPMKEGEKGGTGDTSYPENLIFYCWVITAVFDVTISVLNSNSYTKWSLYKLRKEKWIWLLQRQTVKLFHRVKPNKSWKQQLPLWNKILFPVNLTMWRFLITHNLFSNNWIYQSWPYLSSTEK